MMGNLKKEKEQFVSNLSGSSIEEIYSVTFITLAAYLLYRLVTKKLGRKVSLPLDYLINCFPCLLGITLYSGNIKVLYFIILAPSILLFFSLKHSKNGVNSKEHHDGFLVKRPFLTAYRSHMLIITNLAIFAVDFHIFPRRFAKVETWGTSMMDLGVGSFVFSMGLANSRSLLKKQKENTESTDSSTFFKIRQYLLLLKRSTIKSLPVLLLGVIRLVSVKSLEYQEHITEYGIHWNFFITLGSLPIILAILDPLITVIPRAILALFVGLVYELILVKWGALQFILRNDNRTSSLIAMNKEGIFSLVGYLSIFLLGQSCGPFVLNNNVNLVDALYISRVSSRRVQKKTTNKKQRSISTTTSLIVGTILTQTIFVYANELPFFTGVSRRLANLTYVLWVASYNVTALLVYHLAEKIISFPQRFESELLNAINRNGLATFLLANLLTGLINMTINTLQCNEVESFVILLLYSIILCVVPVVLNRYGIYIKL